MIPASIPVLKQNAISKCTVNRPCNHMEMRVRRDMHIESVGALSKAGMAGLVENLKRQFQVYKHYQQMRYSEVYDKLH